MDMNLEKNDLQERFFQVNPKRKVPTRIGIYRIDRDKTASSADWTKISGCEWNQMNLLHI